MKIAITIAMTPFLYGGAEFLAVSLNNKLLELGFESQVIRCHYSEYSVDNILDSMMVARLTRLDNVDMMISLKFPAYLIPHENKRLWLLHQLRPAYDLEGIQPYDFFAYSNYAQKIKNNIINSDNTFLSPLEGRIFTISQVVSDRLKKYNKIDSDYLYPPIIDEEMFYKGEKGDYIFYPSRISVSKRQGLLVEAMKFTKSNVKLVLAGKGDSIQNEEEIIHLIERYNLSGKITYINRFITQKEKCDLYANCLGAAFIPLDEDYGYITIEAFKSSKPVITCVDSGCPALFVQHEQCGYVVNPTAQELAAAMDMLYENTKNAIEMGQNANERLKKLNINWETVLSRLIQ